MTEDQKIAIAAPEDIVVIATNEIAKTYSAYQSKIFGSAAQLAIDRVKAFHTETEIEVGETVRTNLSNTDTAVTKMHELHEKTVEIITVCKRCKTEIARETVKSEVRTKPIYRIVDSCDGCEDKNL